MSDPQTADILHRSRGWDSVEGPDNVRRDAAIEIERLRARVAELEAAVDQAKQAPLAAGAALARAEREEAARGTGSR